MKNCNMTIIFFTLLRRPPTRNARRSATRRCRHGELVQPFKGYFADANEWESATEKERAISKIFPIAQAHPHWALLAISTAVFYGVTVGNADLYKFVHFAVDIHTTSSKRKNLPIRFHYIKEGRTEKIDRKNAQKALGSLASKSGYTPISETLGIMNGILVTSPLQTIFDCMRMLPFEEAIVICDAIAKKFGIKYRDILRFMLKRRGCWKADIAGYKQAFIDPKSENGGESFCRARMIRAGFRVPKLQVEMKKPLYALENKYGNNLKTTRTIRPDFMWKDERKKSSFKYIVGELDGHAKYTNQEMLRNQGARSTDDVILREKDRETALNLANIKVVRFTFAHALYDGGYQMIEKLKMAGVPMVNGWERKKRKRLLARFLGERTLHRLQ